LDGQRATGHLGLVRVRLFDQLDAAGASGAAMLVAPAGFGKTTLLAQYARRHVGPVAAYHADAMEVTHGDTAVRLVEAVLAAVRRSRDDAGPTGVTGPGSPSGNGTGPAVDRASDLAAARRAVEAARDECTAVTEAMAAAVEQVGDLLATFDNIDHLIGTPGESVIGRVLARRPSGVQIVLASRRMPRLNLLRHEMAGEAALLGVDDLRFRRWEVERLLDEVYGEPLPPDDAAQLARRTGGWPAGLALFHLATRGRPTADRRRAAVAPLGRWPAFRQYFADTVLANASPETLEFLTRTCVFEVLTADRCARIMDRDSDGGMLDDLAQVQALPITTHGDTYRYEVAFRAHLETLLADRLGAKGLREWHRRAGDLLVAEEAYPEAARSYARAGEWTELRQLLAEHGEAAVAPPTAELLELVPAAQRADEPWFAYAEAVQHQYDAHLPAAYEGFDRAARMFAAVAQAGDGNSSPGQRAAELERDGVAELLAQQMPKDPLHWTSWLRVAVGAHAATATRHITQLSPAEAELVRLVGAVFGGGVPEGITRDTHAVAMGTEDSPTAELGLRLVRTSLAVSRGTASPLALERIADEAESLGLGWVARLALACRALGRTSYTAATAYAVAAACRRSGDRWGFVLATSVGAISEQREGRLDEERLATLSKESRELGADAIAEWAEAFIVLAQARRGVPEAGEQARLAVERAELAGVPGAAVVATLALAVTDPVRRPALLREAATRGEAIALPPATVRFWLATYAATVAASPAMVVNIRCFGGFRMEVGGRVVDLSTVRPRARSALRLLAMQAGRFVHREVLIEALWSDLAPAAATRNLQVTISALRGLIEPYSGRGKAQLLVRSGDAYGITLPPGGYADTSAFTDAVHRWQQMRRTGSFASEVDAMRTALAAYNGELLPEEGPADWAVEARDHFLHLATRVARELATAELTQGNVTEAVRAAEQCIALDPHDDEAWQVLLRAYARSATPARAADARRRYADMLAGLGVTEPTPQQIQGAHQIPRQLRRSPVND
jgi:DNA-binding SARP family transcriptional activator